MIKLFIMDEITEHACHLHLDTARTILRQSGDWPEDYEKALDKLEVSSSKPYNKKVQIYLLFVSQNAIRWRPEWWWNKNADFVECDLVKWLEDRKEEIVKEYQKFIRQKGFFNARVAT